VSIFAKTCADAERVWSIARGGGREPGPGEDAAPWIASDEFRFGVPAPEHLEFFGDTEAQALYETSIYELEAIGGKCVTIDFAPFRAAAELLYSGPWVAERLAAIGPFVPTDPIVRKILEGGAKYSAVDAYRAMYRLEELRLLADRQLEDVDVLLLPTTGTIYTHEQLAKDPVQLNTNLGYYTNFVNLLDMAALAIPAGFRSNGLPFGVTLMGRKFTDAALTRLGSRLTQTPTPIESIGCVEVAVVGAHLTGQPLNRQLTERGARLVKTCRTAANYRLYALQNTTPPKPGLVRDPRFIGPGVEVEVWAVPENEFGSFVAAIPPPLGIGSATLDDGSRVNSFICEPYAVEGAKEITNYGGWRKYLAAGA
jgi:allophanate hydrolase